MKIISLTIKNLASIQGTYHIDFEEGALGSCGLFCITGTTGSGKSTILDAISLALYGKTPRYLSALATAQWQVELDPKDPRNMLHRGESECLSEVLFLASNGYRYKSSWFCELSKKGKYKSPISRLEALEEDIDDIEVKSNRFENITKEKIGLSYDQFSRTVLLAQNQFSSFLKAKESDKSTLLEKLTGTEIYSLISIEIFNKKRNAEKTLKALTDKLSAYNILTDEEFLKYSNDQKNILASKNKYQENLKNLNKQSGDRISLEKSLFDLSQEIKSLEKKQETLSIEKQSDQKAYNMAKESQIIFDTELNKIDTELNKARILDDRLKDYKLSLDKVKNEYSSISEDVIKQKADIKNKENQVYINDQEIKSCDFYFKENIDLSTIFENYDALKLKLEQAAYELQEINIQNVEIQKNKSLFNKIETELEAKKIEQENENLNFNKLQKETNDLKLKIKDIDIDKSQNNYKKYQTKLLMLNKDIEAWSLWCTSLEEKNKKTEELNKVTKEIKEIIKKEKSLKDNVVESENAYEKQDKELQRIALFNNHSIEELRSNLKEGEKCPVCGSHTHPFIYNIQDKLNFLTKNILETCQKEKLRLDNKRREAIKSLEFWKEKLALLSQQKNNLFEDIKLFEYKIKEYSKKYANVTKLFQDAQLLSKEGQRLALNKMNVFLNKINAYIKTSEDNIESYNKINKLISNNIEALAKIQTKKDNIDKTIIKQQEKYTIVKTNITNQIEENKKYIIEYNKQIKEINFQITIEGWLNKFETEPIKFIEKFSNSYSIWNKKIKIKEIKLRENERIQSNVLLLKGQLERYIQSQKNCKEKLDGKEELFNNSQIQRNKLLGGKDVLLFEKELNIKTQEIKKEIEKQKANLDLKAGIINQNLGQITAYKRQEEEKKMELEKHIKLLGPLENIKKQIIDCESKIKELEPDLERLNSQLLFHKENLKQIESHKVELDNKRNNLDNWNKLSSEFGNASGDSFKKIAQEYTMSILLTYANKQLELLTNRYTLCQVKNTLTLNIIDHEMANTERTVNSLSGGETFLISLGLALGLSTLASGKIRIESLFIDEGFGSLDTDTLRITLDALEQLQAQGRKVGIISHVEELKERISAQINIIKKSNGNSRILVTN